MLHYTLALYTKRYSRSRAPDPLLVPSIQGSAFEPTLASQVSGPQPYGSCICQTEEMLANILQNIFEYMLCIVVLSDSSWTIILIDIVVSDQVCVLYASSRKRAGEGEDWCQLT